MQAPEKISGWDFSYLERSRRMVKSPLPRNYYNELLPYLRPGICVLDMGTGGGAFLSLLPHKEQYHIYATEGYADNIPVAAARLAGFGATLVSEYEDDALPFDDGFFDLVINRHESYVLG
ncbi:class I SAM-dependent methyltransferase [Taibaiella helva]|uniref:class I SAM-dependent methyltransferase n=1 Tax=Taibaiella helva TaxID=2301235 RepID=UPI000E57F4EB|nr:methyltransferase domain-containing protein [Taibaiella helva]